MTLLGHLRCKTVKIMLYFHHLVFKNLRLERNNCESGGLAVGHSAHNRKDVGLIPVQSNARWKWCQSHARMIPTPNAGSI